jgi:hypothetical protein
MRNKDSNSSVVHYRRMRRIAVIGQWRVQSNRKLFEAQTYLVAVG